MWEKLLKTQSSFYEFGFIHKFTLDIIQPSQLAAATTQYCIAGKGD